MTQEFYCPVRKSAGAFTALSVLLWKSFLEDVFGMRFFFFFKKTKLIFLGRWYLCH